MTVKRIPSISVRFSNGVLFALGMMCIVKPEGLPQLCKTDEIGEICVSSRTGGMMYYGLAGVTKNTFEVCNCMFGYSFIH